MFDFDALLWRHRPPSAPAGRTREGNSDLRISACNRNGTTVEESKDIEKDAEIICTADGLVQRDSQMVRVTARHLPRGSVGGRHKDI